MKYSKSAIGLLTREYRSVLKKCLLINLGLFALGAIATPAKAADVNTATELNSALVAGSGITVTGDISNISDITAINNKENTLNMNNHTLSGASTGNSGYNFTNGSLTIDGNGTFSGLNNGTGKGILTFTSTDVEANGALTFSNNKSSQHGAAFYYKDQTAGADGTAATFNGNVTFSGNESGDATKTNVASSGGAVLSTGGSMSFLGATNSFTGNKVLGTDVSAKQYKRGGGAIANQSYWNESSHASIDSIMVIGSNNSTNTFSSNSSSMNGGAIMNRAIDDDGDAYLTINGTSTFDHNTAGINGGAIYNYADNNHKAEVTFSDAGFTYNSAYNGGALYNSNGKMSVNSASFTNNTATNFGGAILTQGAASTLTINDSEFSKNYADVGGVLAELLHSGQTTIKNSTFENNSANEIGALYLLSATALIDNSTFTGNKSLNTEKSIMYDGGGAIWGGSESTTTIKNSTFENNTSGTDGGAIASRRFSRGNNVAATLDIDNTTFTSNTAGRTGGAIDNYLYNDANGDGYVKVTKSSFASNSAANGGAVYNHIGKDGDVKTSGQTQVAKIYFEDSNFTGNTASALGGALYNEGEATIAANTTDVTFSGNKANGVDNDIYNLGKLALTAASGRKISLAGGIDGDSVNKGTVNIAGDVEVSNALKNQTVAHNSGELHLNNTDLTGSTINVASGAIINTIDNVINDYSESITLANGAKVKGDLNFTEGTADKYAASSGTIHYLVSHLMGAASNGKKAIQVAGEGSTIDISQAIFDSDTGMTFASSGSADGKIIVKGIAGGIEAAADASEDVSYIQYNLTDDEAINTAKEIKDNFVLNGAGVGADAKGVTLNADLGVANGADLALNNLKLDGSAALNNDERGTLRINDSQIGVKVNNAGILISDPTYYTAQVVNSGTATFAGDIFAEGSSLENNATVNLLKGTEFVSGVGISGNGVINLIEGQMKFNNNSNTNTIKVAKNADWKGAINGGTVNTQNGAIDAITGSVSNGTNLYVDANLGDKKVDTISGGLIKKVNLLASGYGTDSEVTLAGNYDTNVEVDGFSYYTKVEKTDTGLKFSDKLVNQTGMEKYVANNAADAIFTQASGGNPAVTIRAAINSKADATETATALGAKFDNNKLIKLTPGEYTNPAVGDDTVYTSAKVNDLMTAAATTASSTYFAKDHIYKTTTEEAPATGVADDYVYSVKKANATFATAAQGTKAESAIQSVKVNGTALTPDSNKAVNLGAAAGAGLTTLASAESGNDTVYTVAKVNDLLAGKSNTGHTHVSSDVTAMTGYSKASAVAAIATDDSLNMAIGKLEYKADKNATDISTNTGAINTLNGTVNDANSVLNSIRGNAASAYFDPTNTDAGTIKSNIEAKLDTATFNGYLVGGEGTDATKIARTSLDSSTTTSLGLADSSIQSVSIDTTNADYLSASTSASGAVTITAAKIAESHLASALATKINGKFDVANIIPTDVATDDNDHVYSAAKADDKFAAKATSLAGYGITDAYTQAEVQTYVANNAADAIFTSASGDDPAVTIRAAINSKADATETATALGLKADTAKLQTTTADAADGYDINAKTLKVAGVDAVTVSGNQTLTNKTIDAASNTISNLGVANLASTSVLKIADVTAGGFNPTTLDDTKLATAGAIYTAVNGVINYKQNTWGSKELGYDTATTDAPTKLAALGFEAETETVGEEQVSRLGFLQAVKQNKASIDAYKTLNDARFEDKTGVEGKFTVAESIQNRIQGAANGDADNEEIDANTKVYSVAGANEAIQAALSDDEQDIKANNITAHSATITKSADAGGAATGITALSVTATDTDAAAGTPAPKTTTFVVNSNGVSINGGAPVTGVTTSMINDSNKSGATLATAQSVYEALGKVHGLITADTPADPNTTYTFTGGAGKSHNADTDGSNYRGNLAVGTTVADDLIELDNVFGKMQDLSGTDLVAYKKATGDGNVAENLKKLNDAIHGMTGTKESVTFGDAATTTTMGNTNAKIVLSESGQTATVTAANGLVLNGSQAITGIDNTTIPVSATDPTADGKEKVLATTATVARAVKDISDTATAAWNHAEGWLNTALGIDSTSHDADEALQVALNDLGAAAPTGDGKGNNIAATSIAGALHELDVEKAGLATANQFTNTNDFTQGLKVSNGTVTTADGYAASTLTATADGLNISAGAKVNGALTATGDITAPNVTGTTSVITPKLKLGAAGAEKDLTASSYEANLVTVTPYVAATGTAPTITFDGGDNATVATTKTVNDSLAGVVTYAGEVFKQKQDWMSQEFGYDTNTTDANTVLGASGAKYADQNGDGKVGFADALIQLNGDATVAGSVKNSIKTLAAGADYDNTTSGLVAETIQAAIDANAANIKANAIINADSVSKAGYVATDTVKAAVVAIDAALHEDEYLLGDAQTSAATSGILTGKIIGGKDADATKNINVVDAIDLIAKKAVGLDTANVFTNLNTFKYDGGIALQDSAGGNSTRLKATAKGLEVDRTVVAEGFRLGDNTVTSIDVDGSAVGAATANANKMATGSTVYYGAKDANYTGTRVAGATSTATLGNAISEATTLANTIETKITVAAGTYKAISAGDGVAANLVALDSAVGTIQTSDTKQNKQLDTLATEIGGSYASDGTFTHTPFTSTNNISATDPITTAISSIDAAIGEAGTLNSGIAGYTGTEVVGAVKQLSANLTNGTVNANFGSTTVDSLAIDGTAYGIDNTGAASFASVAANSVTTNSLKIGDAAAITATTTGLNMGNNDLSNIAKISFHGSTDYVNAIDTGAAAKTASSENNATTMATVATVLKSAENAEFTKSAENASSAALGTATTINAAINNVAAAVDTITDGMGNVADLATQAAVPGSNINNPAPGSSPTHAPTVVSAIKDLDNAIGNIENGITHDFAKNGGTVPNNVAGIIQTVAENVYAEIHGDNDPTTTDDVTIGDKAARTTVGVVTPVGTDNYLTGLQVDTTDSSTTLAAYDATNGKMLGMKVDAKNQKIAIGDSADDAYGLEMDTANGLTSIGDGTDRVEIGKGTLEIGQMMPNTTGPADTHFEAGLHMDKDTVQVGDMTANGVKLDATDGSITATGDANIGGKATAKTFANTNETFTVDAAGQVKGRNFSNNTGTFSVSNGGSLTASEYHNGKNSFVVNTKGDVTAHSLTFNRTDKVNAIDVNGSNVSATVAAATRKQTMATAETVYLGAENAKYTNNGTGVVKAKNVATLHDAIQVLDNAMGTMALNKQNKNLVDDSGATLTNATDALNALDGVVGNVKDLNVSKGNLHATKKDVASHLSALDARLGEIKAINVGKGNLAKADSDVATHFGSLDTAIGNRKVYNNENNFTGYVAVNDGTKDLTTMISEVASNIGKAGDITSTNQISAQQTVNANLSSLDAAIGNVADLQQLGYSNVTQAIIGTDAKFTKAIHDLDMDQRKLRHDFEAGMAGQAALSALVPNAKASGNTQLAVGTGAYKGHTAAAVGGFHWFTDNLLFNAGVAWDNNEATGRMGITYSW